MHTYGGSCRCGNLTFTVNLPKAIDQYTARRCDCDFCTARGMDYLSDPDGTVELTFRQAPERIVQGDELAQFLTCAGCGDVAAVMLDEAPAPMGAVNARLLQPSADIDAEQVSPRLLSADEKLARWRTLWCSMRLIARPGE